MAAVRRDAADAVRQLARRPGGRRRRARARDVPEAPGLRRRRHESLPTGDGAARLGRTRSTATSATTATAAYPSKPGGSSPCSPWSCGSSASAASRVPPCCSWSILAALAFAAVLWRLVVIEGWGDQTGERVVWLLVLAPPAFVLVMGYTEALAGLAAVLVFLGLLLSTGGSPPAAGAAAALCRPTGLLLCVPALIEAVRQHRRPLIELPRSALLPLRGGGRRPAGWGRAVLRLPRGAVRRRVAAVADPAGSPAARAGLEPGHHRGARGTRPRPR